MQKLRLNDNAMVISGKDKGKTGKILKIYPKKNKVLLEGINIVKKAIKPTQESPEGGFAEVIRPIHRSNVMLISPKTNKPSRVGVVLKDGKNQRVLKACGTVLDN